VERPELKLVTPAPRRIGTPEAAALGVAVLAVAALASVFGADAARRPFDPAAGAEAGLARTLATGDPGPARQAEAALRRRLTDTPLDAATRTVLASLMAETATDAGSREAAARQAVAATALIRSDEWIAAGTARVLARCGRGDLALEQTARVFAYAPDDAAKTLADVEPWVPAERLEEGIPATPKAWLAWSTRLRETGRDREADRRLSELLLRWPGDLDALAVAASAAASRDRIDELRRLVPPTLALPDEERAASLFAFRARSHAAAGNQTAAKDDAARAIALSRGNPWVYALAGDALVDVEPAMARDYWSRGLYRLPATPGARDAAVWFRFRLARLDDREGRGGDALREWRAILALRPDDAEAKHRIASLTGR